MNYVGLERATKRNRRAREFGNGPMACLPQCNTMCISSLPAQLVRQIESTLAVVSPCVVTSATDALRNKWEKEMIQLFCETMHASSNRL